MIIAAEAMATMGLPMEGAAAIQARPCHQPDPGMAGSNANDCNTGGVVGQTEGLSPNRAHQLALGSFVGYNANQLAMVAITKTESLDCADGLGLSCCLRVSHLMGDERG